MLLGEKKEVGLHMEIIKRDDTDFKSFKIKFLFLSLKKKIYMHINMYIFFIHRKNNFGF